MAVIRVPWDYDFNQLEYDGLFISNGPGDPDTCDAAVRNIRKALPGISRFAVFAWVTSCWRKPAVLLSIN